jgi:predicted acyltransferase
MSSELPSTPSPAAGGRLASLDALRGFDMFWITGGAVVVGSLVKALDWPELARIPPQFEHVKWEGFHFIDLIFPLFLFLIGVAIPFSFAKRLARGDSYGQLYRHIVVRVVILIVLGMMVNGSLLSYDWHKFELSYSVLQMLALGYLVASILFLNLRLKWQIIATAAMLVGYWAILAFVPGPGHQIGVVQEGCNLGDWLTESLVGRWRGIQVGWILGVLGHASTAMLGVFAGQLLRSSLSEYRKVGMLVLLGMGCLAGGLFWGGWVARHAPGLSLFGQDWTEWPVWCPIIKNRWTSSYALYAGGWSYLLLALFYLVLDVWRWRRWAFPLMFIGANSIFAYMVWQLASGLLRQAGEVFLGGLKPYVGPVWYEPIAWSGATAVLWLMLWYLYRNRTFIRV